MKTVLLTGGLWYIWSHTCVAFEKAWVQTVLLDNLCNASAKVLDAIEEIIGRRPVFFKADIRDSEAVSEILRSYEFDAVVHFAGLKSVGESVNDPFGYYDNNIQGSLVLFWELEKAWVRKIIFSSSATVYDASNPLPFHEDGRLGATNPYGTSKLVNEFFLKDLAFSKKWKAIALRYFNPIGAHESGLIWERPNGTPDNLLPYVLDVAIWKREVVSVYGSDYQTPDGTGVRDYVHVCDLAEAHVATYDHLNSIAENGYFDVFNVGTWKGTSVLEMIALVEEVSGRRISKKIVSRRPWDIAEAVADAGLIRKEMNWSAKRSVHDAVVANWNFVNNLN